jgi:polysaccharide chain length determinant protein (PEP-CTERM system associated)
MLPGKSFTPEDIIAILLRRRWLILIPFALGLTLAPWIAERIPRLYRSETLIMVIPSRVPDSYVKSTVTATVEDRLPTISDQILSRTRLERVITDFDLYRGVRAKATMEDVVAKMRQDIGPVQIQPRQQSFRVTYASTDPVLAQKVTARLASIFIEENSRDRENLAESTSVFLESQLEDVSQRLIEHERKVEEFKQRYSGELPSQLPSNVQAITTAQLQIQALSESQNRATERRLLFERQLADAQSAPTPAAASTGGGNQDGLSGLTAAQQLEAVEARLETAKLRYTSDHPDVRTLERTVRELRVRAEAEAKRPREQAPVVISPAEQARQRRIRDLQAEIDVIDHQLTTSRANEAKLKAEIDDYRRKVEAAPRRESELVELTRDYEILKKTYESLRTKREDSQLAANLERRQIGEQFRILDPASLPARPDGQMRRLVLSFSGAGAGLAIGLLLTAFLEYRSSSLANEADVTRLLDLPVLALVPMMTSDLDVKRRRHRLLAVDVTGTAVVVGALAVVATWGLRQL